MKLAFISIILLIASEVNSLTVKCVYYNKYIRVFGRMQTPLKDYKCTFALDEDMTHLEVQHKDSKNNNDITEIFKNQEPFLNLSNFPSIVCETFPNLANMYWKFFQFANIDENSLENCKKVCFLVLSNNNIQKLPQKFFAAQSNVYHLDLGFNLLEELPDGILDPLINVVWLYLNNNKLKTLSPRIFKNLVRVQGIFLNNNEIQELPADIFTSIKDLYVIDLNGNKLKTLNYNSFGYLRNVNELLIDDNEINSIDEEIITDTMKKVTAVGNPCYNGSVVQQGYENSQKRAYIRETLKKCFENHLRERESDKLNEIH